MTNYRELDAAKIVETLETLEHRISERFPNSGLSRLCGQVKEAARTSRSRARSIVRANISLRILTTLLICCGAAALLLIASRLDFARGADSSYTVLQGVDSAFNIIVLFGAMVLGVRRHEMTVKRTRALAYLHELRSLIHVIDMHQLTKDPSVVTHPDDRTPSSPQMNFTPYQLQRYLDYCSEMLSLTAKIAAIYAQSSADSVVISTVNDLEQLAANLSHKIWQKIGLLREAANAAGAAKPRRPSPQPVAPAPVAVAARVDGG